jgi:CDGSH-type Zn-finger protein
MAATTITIRTDGSIRVEGDFQIVDQDGKPFGLGGRTKIGLCRCGHSENKPFCDGAHKRVNFQSPIQAFDLPAAAPAPSVASPAAPSAPAETPANPKP